MSLEIHPERSTVEELSIMQDDDPQSTKRGTKLILAIICFIVAGAAVSRCEAGEVFRGTDDAGGPAVLKLHDLPCTNAKVLTQLRDKLLDDRRFKASTLTWHGREWASCWAERRGIVHSMDEEGSPFQPLPRPLFRDESI